LSDLHRQAEDEKDEKLAPEAQVLEVDGQQQPEWDENKHVVDDLT
jgi:hypothetical protein